MYTLIFVYQNNQAFVFCSIDKRNIIIYNAMVDKTHRGVAQLVARLLWEQDVGSSSLFTPTIKNVMPSGVAFFIFVLNMF